MKRKHLVMMLVSILMVVFLTACGSDNSTANPNTNDANNQSNETKEKFRVGMEAAYARFNWTQVDDSNGAVPISGAKEYAAGYDVEIAKKIAEGLGKELEIVKISWSGLEPAVTSGTVDAIIAGMSATEKRKEQIDFTDNYYTSDLVMLVQKGSQYENATSIQDFSGAKITAQLSTFHYDVIDQIQGVNKQTAMDDFTALRVALQSGIIDGYVAERPEGLSAEVAIPGFTMIEFAEGQGFQADVNEVSIAVGLKKNSPLTTQINEILAGISEEERTQLMNQAVQNQPAMN